MLPEYSMEILVHVQLCIHWCIREWSAKSLCACDFQSLLLQLSNLFWSEWTRIRRVLTVFCCCVTAEAITCGVVDCAPKQLVMSDFHPRCFWKIRHEAVCISYVPLSVLQMGIQSLQRVKNPCTIDFHYFLVALLFGVRLGVEMQDSQPCILPPAFSVSTLELHEVLVVTATALLISRMG